ncbi:hypothetical protein Tco_0519513 [Tanacetum coccineum]
MTRERLKFANEAVAIQEWGSFLGENKTPVLLLLDDVWSHSLIEKFKFKLPGYKILVDKCHGHILRYGFLPGYTNWSVHGENSVPSQPSRPTFVHETSFGEDEIRSLVRDALGQIP